MIVRVLFSSVLLILVVAACSDDPPSVAVVPDAPSQAVIDDLYDSGQSFVLLVDRIVGRALLAVEAASELSGVPLTVTGTVTEVVDGWSYSPDVESEGALTAHPLDGPSYTFRFLKHDWNFPPAIEWDWSTANGRWFWGRFEVVVSSADGEMTLDQRGWAPGYKPGEPVRHVNFDRHLYGAWTMEGGMRSFAVDHWGRSSVTDEVVSAAEIVRGTLTWDRGSLDLDETRLFEITKGPEELAMRESWSWTIGTGGKLDGAPCGFLSLHIAGAQSGADAPAPYVPEAEAWLVGGEFAMDDRPVGSVVYEYPVVATQAGPPALLRWPNGETRMICASGVPIWLREHIEDVTRITPLRE